MKIVTWNKQQRSIVDNTTPFKVIKFEGNGVELRLYWTSGTGMYGPQVWAFLYGYKSESYHYKTTGCGYDKEAHAIEQCLKFMGMDKETFNPRHVGGNFWVSE